MKKADPQGSTNECDREESSRIRSLAHDINNSLMSCTGALQSLLRNTEKSSSNYKRLKLLLSGISDASELVKQLYDTTRGLNQKLVNLSAITEEACQFFKESLRKEVSLHFKLEAGICVNANSVQLKRVILNLLVNAEQAISESGKITLELSSHEEENRAELVITDTGCGMSEETLFKIDKGAYSTKGTGLIRGQGLTNVRKILESHDATLHITSKEGIGSSFSLDFPLVSLLTRKPETTIISENANILLVDPDESLHSSLSPFLQQAEINITSFASFELAYDWYAQQSDKIALIFLYGKSDCENILEWFPKFQSIDPTSPVIISSPHCNKTLTSATGQKGLHCFSWPLNFPETTKMITDILGSEQHPQS